MFNLVHASPSTGMSLRRNAASLIAAVFAFALPFAASAQAFGQAVKTEIDAGKPELWLIGGSILGLCIVAALVNRGKSVTK